MNHLIVFLVIVLNISRASAAITAQISNMGDTTHLEFSGQGQWDYDIARKDKGDQTIVELIVPSLSDSAVAELQAFRSVDVKGVEISRNAPDGKMQVKMTFAQKGVETFDYLTDQPSRLVVDIFKAKGTAKTATAQATPTPPVTEKKVAAKVASASRLPATTDILKINPTAGPLLAQAEQTNEPRTGIFDGADPGFERFSIADYEVKEDSIIASQEKVYLDFPILRLDLGQLERLNSHKPVYEILAKDSDENKQARLLLTLFTNKRYNVYLKTVEWFIQKYPKSEYDEIVRFMWADTLYELWKEKHNINDFDLAMLRYRQALEMYPQTQLAERTLLLMGYATLDRGDYLGTLRQFQSHIKNRPQSKNRDLARLAVAEAYLKISRYEDSAQLFEEIEKDSYVEKAKLDAAYKIGDVFIQKKDFEKAEQKYNEALNKYPSGSTEYPNAFYNRATAQFGQKNFRKSLESYRDFLKRFPSHPFAGYAMTRVGELLDILGADRTRVMGAYLETFFRYGNAPSAIVARLRLLSAKMKTMKPKEVDKAVDEISELAKKSELEHVQQFATLMIAEGYSSRKDFDRSINLLIKYYQTNPTSADTSLLSRRIIGNINDKIEDEINQGDYLGALKTHNYYVDNWLKPSQRIDTKYMIGRAFELAGVPAQAEGLYRDTLNKIYSLRGTTLGKTRGIVERLPTEDALNLRLANISFQQGKLSESYDYLKTIKKPELMSDAEQIERVQLGSMLLEKKGDPASAVRYLVELLKNWKGRPELVADPYLFLGEIEARQGKVNEAIESYSKIDQLMEDSGGKVPTEVHLQALQKMSELQLEKGMTEAAQKSMAKLLSLYEAKRPMASMRYKLGQTYFKKGEIQKAADTWGELKGKQNDFWYSLAQEQLKNSDWQNDYKKYIKRIPAMSERVNK